MDIKRLERIQSENPNLKFMLHNGYFAWSYGSPQNPIFISNDTAIKILLEFEKRTGKDAVDEMKSSIFDLVYAEENDDLYYKTGRNRIIGLYDVDSCIFTAEADKEKVYDLDI